MKIRTRIFLVFTLLMGLGIFSFVYWMHGEMRPRYMEAQEDTLVDLSQLLAGIISTQAVTEKNELARIDTEFLSKGFNDLATRQIDARIYELHKQRVDIRIYVTDHNGTVIYDSDEQRDLGKDYSQWRDVHLTLAGKYGARSTDGDSLYPEGSTMYIAAPIMIGMDIAGVVSIGKPTRNAERFMKHLLDNITIVGIIISGVAIIIGLFINSWISRPLAKLQNYADKITLGERVTLPDLGKNEVGQVGLAMESMRKALDGKSYVSDYVQSLTHELKSPIAAIRGASELLSEDMALEDRKRFLDNISVQSLRMQELIDRLLELASLEYRPELSLLDDIDIDDLIDEVIDSLAPAAHAKNIELIKDGDKHLQMKGDNFLISKALTNILKNAIEFSPENSSVVIKCIRLQHNIEINICDRGSGIPGYARENVFERFYSLPKADGQKGSGLGLSFVREIAALHNAEAVIQDNVEANSGICVSLKFLQQG